MRVIHEWGKYIAIEKDGVERLCYNYQLDGDPNPSAPKPFIHPIRTPNGIIATAESPLDHIWHRGLWFAWKFVNGVNYWEENQEIVGRQVTMGVPTVSGGHIPETVQIASLLQWRDNKDGQEQIRLSEVRIVTCCLKEDGAILFDWESRLTPHGDVLLDRTPFTTWGGYGGLTVRTTQAIQNQRIIFDDGTTTNRPTGERYRWGVIEGSLDTGPGTNYAAFVFMPSPASRRFPEPFYGTAKPFFNFFGPAPLFYEALPLEAHKPLVHNVRVLFLPRPVTAKEVEPYYEEWVHLQTRTGEDEDPA